jgi:ribosomal protein S24E
MDIEIVSKKENPLLDRTELEVVARHEGAPTPKRDELRELVAAALKVKKDTVVVDHINTRFGLGESKGYVKVYSSKQIAMAVERDEEPPATEPEEAPAKEPEEAPAKEPKEAPAKEAKEAPAKEAKKAPAKEPKEAPAKEPKEAPAKKSAKEE